MAVGSASAQASIVDARKPSRKPTFGPHRPPRFPPLVDATIARFIWDIIGEETEAVFVALPDRVDPTFLAQERAIFLTAPWATRSVLRMHMSLYDDYRLKHRLPNPLDPAGRGG